MDWVIPILEFVLFIVMTVATIFGLGCLDESEKGSRKLKIFKNITMACYIISAILLIIIILLVKNLPPDVKVYAG